MAARGKHTIRHLVTYQLTSPAQKDEPATSLDFEPPYKFDTVRTMGADFFADFPHHQFFVRVHRPFAVSRVIPELDR